MKVLGFITKAVYSIAFAIANAIYYFAELWKAYKAKAHVDLGWERVMYISRVVAANKAAQVVGIW